ncbi:translation initiation factor IF-2-like [Orcinus orca]|uniref:translation initiation factor IF-2-like n=1 Tax=Orcinus orca TaxID=9733 RepID=UPI00211117D3|nr:translation initiation factor IF-2-like [Orcinus orca]
MDAGCGLGRGGRTARTTETAGRGRGSQSSEAARGHSARAQACTPRGRAPSSGPRTCPALVPELSGREGRASGPWRPRRGQSAAGLPTCAQGGRCGRCARRLRRLRRVHCWRRWRRPDPRPPNVSSLLGSGGPRSPSSLTLSLPPSPQVLPPSFSPPEPELSSPPLSRRPAQRSAALRPPPAHPRPGPAGGCGPRASCRRSPVPGEGGWRGSASTPRSYPAPLFPGPRRPPALSQRPRAWAPRALPSLFRCLFTPREAPSTAQRVNEDNMDDKQHAGEEALKQRKQSLENLMIPFSRQG